MKGSRAWEKFKFMIKKSLEWLVVIMEVLFGL